jgi:hypothetical protein
MAFFKRRAASPPPAGLPVFAGGREVQVVGEIHHQATLDRICGGPSKSGHDLAVHAILRREPTNQHDPNAVEVLVGADTVGHLSRDDASAYKADLDAVGGTATCRAHIVGGSDRGGGDPGRYGIVLDLAVPGWTRRA